MECDERIARDRWLRAAVLRGDAEAWRRWHEETASGLLAFVRWRSGGDRHLADEIAQETWLVAVREIKRYDPLAAPFAAWLRGIADHLLRNYLRRRQVRANHALDDQHAAADAGPSRAMEDREHAARVAAALALLPPRYEAALRAKYVDGATVHEIAQLLGTTNKSVESLLTRARGAFRRLYCEPSADQDALDSDNVVADEAHRNGAVRDELAARQADEDETAAEPSAESEPPPRDSCDAANEERLGG